MIYELKFSYYEDNSENNDEIIIAVYSSYKKAEIGKKKFSQQPRFKGKEEFLEINEYKINDCLLYTSDAADDSLRVDLGGRRIIKKKFFQAEDGIRDRSPSRGLGDVYKRQPFA